MLTVDVTGRARKVAFRARSTGVTRPFFIEELPWLGGKTAKL
jgi:hypothetical protein